MDLCAVVQMQARKVGSGAAEQLSSDSGGLQPKTNGPSVASDCLSIGFGAFQKSFYARRQIAGLEHRRMALAIHRQSFEPRMMVFHRLQCFGR